jgi:hypothetical protein
MISFASLAFHPLLSTISVLVERQALTLLISHCPPKHEHFFLYFYQSKLKMLSLYRSQLQLRAVHAVGCITITDRARTGLLFSWAQSKIGGFGASLFSSSQAAPAKQGPHGGVLNKMAPQGLLQSAMPARIPTRVEPKKLDKGLYFVCCC